MPIAITRELLLLCEGASDKAFFRTLLRERNMPSFDIPFPEPRSELDEGKDPLGGRDNFGEMLRLIRVPPGFKNLRGILIVADSATNPTTTFNFVCDRIRSVPGYGIPDQTLVPSQRTADGPPISIMLIPDETTPGGVETLYAREIIQQRDWLSVCVEAFLSCGQIPAHGWAAEKRDKSRFHSMVASLYEHDPSRSASMIWKRGSPLLMNIQAPCFNDVETRIRTFAAAVGAN